MEIEEKIKSYTKYKNRIDKIIKCVSTDELLDEQEQIRFTRYLNSARYHCQGKINKLNEYRNIIV